MVDVKRMLPELRALAQYLAEDLLQRATTEATIDLELRRDFVPIKESGRSSQSYEEWREDYLDQVSVAWVLACVFVRFIEDNGLLDECWLAGEGERRNLADGYYENYFRHHPHSTDREYLKHVFEEVGKIPAAKELFEKGKTPLWAVDPSGDAARRLLNFFKELDPEVGGLKRSFATQHAKTGPIVDVYEKLAPQAQFLGDLYQDLSEHARKKYALLQTPEFIQRFLLDRTLTYALDQFGLRNLRIIDPTCGSGHLLLGAFDRLFEEWMRPERGVNNAVVAAQHALDSIFGVDLNPFAIAITRFRLLVAAIQACKIKRLHQQSYAWKLNLATGDSLLWGSKPSGDGGRIPIQHQSSLFELNPILAVEDPAALRRILGQGYHVVVGNPPYITVKDKNQNEAYRRIYSTCYRKYSLGVPFTQRFWELAIRQGERINSESEDLSTGPGYVGMITANSFMKREFGKKLIEEFFPKVDLTHVLDTSGAYIPGHGTPTVILLGRARKPGGDTVRAVLGIKGEPATPDDPAQGIVWQSIVQHIDIAGAQDSYSSTADVPRATFNVHPWGIGGGGATELVEMIDETAECALGNRADDFGYLGIAADDVMMAERNVFIRHSVEPLLVRDLVTGDQIRDWKTNDGRAVLFPYDAEKLLNIDSYHGFARWMWNYRTVLGNRPTFSRKTYFQEGRSWWGWNQVTLQRLKHAAFITYSSVATHNHFALWRGQAVLNRHAPIIALPAGSNIDEYVELLGLLNSSTACFWMKQSFHNKGSTIDQQGARQRTDAFEDFYEYTGTGLQRFPTSEAKPLLLAHRLDEVVLQLSDVSANSILKGWSMCGNLKALIEGAEAKAGRFREQMISLQEELDWECYRHYGLLADDLCYHADDLPELKLGERAFEIVMARQMKQSDLQSTWFKRHGSTPISEIPGHWPAAYRSLVECRIKVIETDKEIGLIERPENKRRWNTEPWAEHASRALQEWMLNRLETTKYRKGTKDHPELTTAAQIVDVASADAEFLEVAALYRGRQDFDVSALVAELIEAESVPLLTTLRYKPSGLRKREVWEHTWRSQRQEDAGEDVGEIPVPSKYTAADFLKNDYWRLRGKLDVPKERWISFPYCSTESDPSLVVGWAGWNHLEQATAIIAYYDARKREGWDAKRLTPLLSGLDQLLPWIHQWHPEIDAEFGETAGQSLQTMLEHDAHELGLTLEDIRNWTPPTTTRTRRTRT